MRLTSARPMGRQVSGGGFAHQEGIALGAAGQGVHAMTVPRRGDVFVAQEVAHFAIGRNQLGFNRFGVGSSQPGTVLVGEGFRHFADGPVEGALFNGRDELRLELRDDPFHEDARLGQAALDALAHVGFGLFHPDQETVDAAQEIFVILNRFEGLYPGAGPQLYKAVWGTVKLVNWH